MLAVILKILSILGFILLILLCIVVGVLLIVLFVPVIYKINAEKKDSENGNSEIKVNFRANWLFGLLRVRYSYPEPGNVVIKVLGFPLRWKAHSEKSDSKSADTKSADKQNNDSNTVVNSAAQSKSVQKDASEQSAREKESVEHADTVQNITDQEHGDNGQAESAHKEQTEAESKKRSGKFQEKYEELRNKIRQLYDKIKHILENISFYKELLQDQDTKQLLSHAGRRLGKIFRHIRPRKLKADIVFGTGSPDTTGYAYAVYGMISPQLGQDVCITPDFNQNVLTGTVYAGGHITIINLLVNLLAVLVDRRLRILMGRLKAHSGKQKQKQ